MEGVLFFLLYDFFVSFLFSMNLTKLHHRTYEFSLDFRNSLKCYKSLSAKITYENCSSTFHVIDNYKTGTLFFSNKKNQIFVAQVGNNRIFFLSAQPGRPHIEAVKSDAFWVQIGFRRTFEMICFAHQIPLITEITVMDILGNLIKKVQNM